MTAAEAVPVRPGGKPGDMMVEELAYRPLRGRVLWLFAALSAAGVVLAVNQVFNFGFFLGFVLLDNRYLYALGGLFLALVFLAYPWRVKGVTAAVPWWDWLLALAALVAGGVLAWNAERVITEGWEFAAPNWAMWVSAGLWVVIVEATRRTGGLVIAIIVGLFSLYPVVADIMPGPIAGLPQSLPDTLAYHVLSGESSFGIPMRAFGELVVGFIVFGVALNHTGGGKFFNDLAFALVGGWRGGAAQVGVISSGLQGSISGSVISNVISSGVVTIPAMKRTGFSARYAGGVEAVASTGGVLMPPVMGSTAFVMASFLNIPYVEIALAATIPALLYYFGLMVQVDAYAVRRGLKGLPKSELPRAGAVIREGWIYIIVFVVLVVAMVRDNQEAMGPFIATAVLLVLNQLHPRHRMDRAGWLDFFAATGRALAELVAILLGVGLIIGAFAVTGLAGTLVNDLVFLAGGSIAMLLVMGAVTSFIFGMGMTVTACYIFLAITLAPALVKAGLDPLAVHLFIMYWGMVSFITPPVALGAFAAASIARTSAFSVGFEAMRLGSVIYFLPFFFVLNPALIMRGPIQEILIVTATAAIGIALIAAALQGYLLGVGALRGLPGALGRVLLLAGGFALALPGGPAIGIDHGALFLIAVACVIPAILIIRLSRGRPIAAIP